MKSGGEAEALAKLKAEENAEKRKAEEIVGKDDEPDYNHQKDHSMSWACSRGIKRLRTCMNQISGSKAERTARCC